MNSYFATAIPQTRSSSALEELVLNETTARMDWFRRLMDPRRDIDKECGYPPEPVSPQEYMDLYVRDAIAARVVELMPRECWKVHPEVYESEDPKAITPFEEDWAQVGKMLRGEQSWRKDEETHPIWEYLELADELSGIGSYGIVLFGLDDVGEDGDLARPVRVDQPRKLLYVRVFPESLAPVTAFDTNPRSPRYGQPTQYNVTFSDPNLGSGTGGAVGVTTVTRQVHWARVLHVADNTTSNPWYGASRMRPVLNHLLNLKKIYGSSAEGFWQSCFSALSFETHATLGAGVQVDKAKLRESVEEFVNGLTRVLLGRGGSWKSLAPTVVDPTGQIAAQLEAICIKLTCPMRIFKGSERGNLASEQDDENWNGRVAGRQLTHLTPRLVGPCVDRLIGCNVVRRPVESFCVKWPDLTTRTEDQKATVGVKRTQALAQFVNSNSESSVTLLDFLTKFLFFDDTEARAMVRATVLAVGGHEADISPLLDVPGGVAGLTKLFEDLAAGSVTPVQLKETLRQFYHFPESVIARMVPDAPTILSGESNGQQTDSVPAVAPAP